MNVSLNGAMLPEDQAALPVQDAGVQHAVGLFETMYARGPRVFRLEAHLDRLLESARALGLARRLDRDTLAGETRRALEAAALPEARVRLTVTGGGRSLLRDAEAPAEPTRLVEVSEPVAYAPEIFEKGIMVTIGPAAASPFDPLAGHKTLAYWGRLLTLRQAAAAGAGETLWLNVSNHLASGAVSNLLLVKDQKLLTPIARGEEADGALPAPVLPGVTRGAVLEIAQTLGLETEKRMLSIDDLLAADEVLLTNSGWQVLPVRAVEQHTFGDGAAGPITRRLREHLLQRIGQDIGPPPAGGSPETS